MKEGSLLWCILIAVFPICHGLIIFSSTEPILVNKNFQNTNSFLYHFCLPINGLETQKDIYLEILSNDDKEINFLATDFDDNTEGLDYVSYDCSGELSIALVKKYEKQFDSIDLKADIMQGVIISTSQLKEVSIVISSIVNTGPLSESKFFLYYHCLYFT